MAKRHSDDEQLPTQDDNAIDIDPQANTDMVFPEGFYDAEIDVCEATRIPEDAKFDAGEKALRISFRINSDDPELSGKPFRPFPLVTNKPGSSGKFFALIKGLGYDPKTPGRFEPSDWIGRKVTIHLGQKMRGSGDNRTMTNVLKSVRVLD